MHTTKFSGVAEGRPFGTNENTTLIGKSLGDLLATRILFNLVQLFDHYIVVSPSLWWDNETLLRSTPSPTADKISVFVGVGAEGAEMVGYATRLHKKLKSSLGGESDISFKSFPQLNHGDTLHLAVYEAFERLFNRKHTKRKADSDAPNTESPTPPQQGSGI